MDGIAGPGHGAGIGLGGGKLHQIKRRIHNENESLRNHLLSIQQNSQWVDEVREMFPNYALIANLRNGAWYSEKWDAFCYFKSGDGHDNEWNFSLSRLNLNVAKVAGDCGGCIIVDSTRRGKVYPDSLSATIPIWAAVINLILFEENSPPFCPPPWMPPGKTDQIILLIPQLAGSLPHTCQSYIRESLKCHLKSPLIVSWAAPIEGMLQFDGEGVESLFESNDESNPSRIILLSCSDEISEADHSSHHSWYYIKGAGDDDENWSQGLTPELFWRYREKILSSNEPSTVERIAKEIIYQQSLGQDFVAEYNLAECNLHIFRVQTIFRYLTTTSDPHRNVDGIILLLNNSEYLHYEELRAASTDRRHPQLLAISYLSGKKNRTRINFNEIFASVIDFYQKLRQSRPTSSLPTLWIALTECQFMGMDVAIILCLLLCFFDCHFNPLPLPLIPPLFSISKLEIQVMAGCLQSSLPKCVLSRGLLKEIANYFDRDRGLQEVGERNRGEVETSRVLI